MCTRWFWTNSRLGEKWVSSSFVRNTTKEIQDGKEQNENEPVLETEDDSDSEKKNEANQTRRVGKQLGSYTTHDGDAIQAFIEERGMEEYKETKQAEEE